jgi:hypothetical protein
VAEPDLAPLSGDELDVVGARIDRLEDQAADLASLPDPRVVSQLDDVLRGLGPSLAAARTAVAVPALLLLALALASLVLAGRVVADARRDDLALRESRGWSRGQLLRDATGEVLVLALLVLALGPWLAPPLVRGVVGLVGERPATGLEARDWLWAVTAATGGLVLLARAAGAGSREGRAPTGWRRLLPSPRQVAEVLVAVLAVVAWQQSTGPARSDSLVVAAAPALVVLALLLLLARLVPAVTRTAGGWVGRTRGMLGSVVGWQLTRRADQQRSALVTTGLAAAVTVLLAGLVGSWSASQDEQAAVVTAAEVRATGLTTDRATTLVDAVGGAVVERRSAGLGGGTGTVLALPRLEAAGLLVAPSGDPWPRLLDRLAPGRDVVPALVSRAVADQAGDGDRLSLRLAERTVQVQVVGVLPALPTAAPGEPALLVDRDALAAELGRVPPPAVSSDDTEVWTGADPEAVRDAARDFAPGAVVLDRAAVAADLRSGPVGTGLLTASVLALAAAVMLGVLASLSDTAATLRTRRRELASLRAQGLSGQGLVAAVSAERAALLLGSVLVGSGIGWLALRLFLGRLVLADSGVLPSPAARPTAPWPLLVGGTALVVATLLVLAVLSAARVARRPLGADLREAT